MSLLSAMQLLFEMPRCFRLRVLGNAHSARPLICGTRVSEIKISKIVKIKLSFLSFLSLFLSLSLSFSLSFLSLLSSLFSLLFLFFGVSTQSLFSPLCRGPFELGKEWFTETVVLGAMPFPGARSHTSRQSAERTTWCARVATVGSYEHRAQKNGFLCRSYGTALEIPGTDPVANAELEIARGAGGCIDFNAVLSACLNLLSKSPQKGQLPQVLEQARRKCVLPAPGILLLLIENFSGSLPRHDDRQGRAKNAQR